MPDYDTRVGAYGVMLSAGRILLARFDDGAEKRWTLPGGGLEYGESPEHAAIREIFEETGHRVELGRMLGFDTAWIPREARIHGGLRPLQSLRIIFEATIVGGQLRAEMDGSTDDARWFPLDQVRVLPRVPLVDAAIDLWSQADGLGSDHAV